MIRFVQGDIFQSRCEAIVNPINCVGVMGAGLALAFKERYPANYESYVSACREQRIRVGKMFLQHVEEPGNIKWIINYPTKNHWREPSKMAFVRFGLFHFRYILQSNCIKSVAIPKLGCGKGGLNWEEVKKVLEEGLARCKDVDIEIYE